MVDITTQWKANGKVDWGKTGKRMAITIGSVLILGGVGAYVAPKMNLVADGPSPSATQKAEQTVKTQTGLKDSETVVVNKDTNKADVVVKEPGKSSVGASDTGNPYDLLRKNGIPTTLTDEEIMAAEAADLRMQYQGTKVDDVVVKGTGEVGTPPRYGERQISQEEYEMLRDLTPTRELRDKVNEGHDKKAITYDEVLPGKTFKGALEADHIVPMDRITRMDGFGDLTDTQKLAVLNNPDNFIGLSKAANTSKRSKSFEEWTHYKKGKPGEIEVNPEFREIMIVREKELERKIQKQIDDFNELNSKNNDKGDD
ncbi:hypothetical protein ACNQFZ_09695 [Schinkia sp. CFF1]